MDDKLRHVLKNKLDSYETPVPEHLWRAVAAETSATSGGLSALSKWLLTAAAAASIVGGAVWYYVHSNQVNVKVKSTEESKVEETDSTPTMEEARLETPSNSIEPAKEPNPVITEHTADQRPHDVSLIENNSVVSLPSEKTIMEATHPFGEPTSASRGVPIPIENTKKSDGSFTAVQVSRGELDFFFMPVNPKADSYLWDFGDEQISNEVSPVHTYDKTGVYDVILKTTNAQGVETTSMTVECLPDPQWFIPSIFTPNGDGKNDVFDVMALSKYAEPLELLIFNSSGQIVYSQQMTGAWDGTTLQGAAATDGNYMFKLVARNLRHQTVEKSGFIYLQR